MKRFPLFLVALLLAASAWAGVTTITESKQPYEEIIGTIDFSSRLTAGDNVHANGCAAIGYDPAGAVVTDNIVVLDNSAVFDNTFADNVFKDNTVKYLRKGGTDGNTYKITIRCVTDNGAKLEQDVIYKVQEY